VEIGDNVTLGTLDLAGSARLTIRSSYGTLNQSGGECLVLGSSAATAVNLTGGRLDCRSSGTITTLTVAGDDALADFSADGRSKTVGNCTLTRGEIYDPQQSVTYTNGIEPGGRVVALPAG